MQLFRNPARADWPALLARPVQSLAAIEARVAPILAEVRQRGDAAVRAYAQRFDGLQQEHFRVSEETLELAGRQLSPALKDCLLYTSPSPRD